MADKKNPTAQAALSSRLAEPAQAGPVDRSRPRAAGRDRGERIGSERAAASERVVARHVTGAIDVPVPAAVGVRPLTADDVAAFAEFRALRDFDAPHIAAMTARGRRGIFG
jgi:hypothetical protein